MSRLKFRISHAFKVFCVALFNPEFVAHFEVMSKIYKNILRVSVDQKPSAQTVGIIDIDGKENEIVWLWAGAGEGASPLKRIQELGKEKEELRESLKKYRKEGEFVLEIVEPQPAPGVFVPESEIEKLRDARVDAELYDHAESYRDLNAAVEYFLQSIDREEDGDA